MIAYDDQNIFAKILRGEIPCIKVYEDEQTLCFMDIMPRADGHCLVIPKTPCRNMLDASTEQLSACLQTVQKVSQGAMKALGATGVTIQQFNEADGGQEVFHLHYHILPRHGGVALRAPGKMGDMEEIAQIAERIKAAL
jgi:histidine triad (HIT) family protein